MHAGIDKPSSSSVAELSGNLPAFEQPAPVDFYWHKLEIAKGSIKAAAFSIQNPLDALRFVTGMQQEHVEGDQIKPRYEDRRRAIRILQTTLETSVGHAEEPSTGDEAQSDDIRNTLRMIDISERAGARLNKTLSEIAEAKAPLGELINHTREKVVEDHSFDEEDLANIDMISQGIDDDIHADVRNMELRDIWNLRHSYVRRLGADSMPHAVRIAIEKGIIRLDNPQSNAVIEPEERDLQILEFYSRGKRAQEIATITGRSENTINGRITRLVNQLGANNRRHLVRRAFEKGVLKPDPGTYMHIADSYDALSEAESQIVLMKEHLAKFRLIAHRLAGEEFDINIDEAGNGNGVSKPDDKSDIGDNAVAVFSKVQRTLSRTDKAVHKVSKDIFDLMISAYRASSSSKIKLTSGQQAELEYLAEGGRLSERAENASEAESLSHYRFRAAKNLQADSLPEAVRLAIEAGLLPIEWARPEDQKHIEDSRIITLLSLLSRGQDTSTIAQALGVESRETVRRYASKAKEILGETDYPSLVRRAYEESILMLDYNPAGELQRANQSAALIKQSLERAMLNLSGIDPVKVNMFLYDLSAKDVEEIEKISTGQTAEERSEEKQELTKDGVYSHRARISSKLGAKTMAQTVVLSIEKGLLNVEGPKSIGPEVEISEIALNDLLELARGALINEIAQRANQSRHSVANRFYSTRKKLQATNQPHAMRRAYETGVF